jgi:hypothetical protein
MSVNDALFCGYKSIVDAVASALTVRRKLKFDGSLMRVTDDPVNQRTCVESVDENTGLASIYMNGTSQTVPTDMLDKIAIRTTGFIGSSQVLTFPARTDAESRIYILRGDHTGSTIYIRDTNYPTSPDFYISPGSISVVRFDGSGPKRLFG